MEKFIEKHYGIILAIGLGIYALSLKLENNKLKKANGTTFDLMKSGQLDYKPKK